ncbi:hypothetical protein VPG91_11570 [Nitrospirillum amazonense]|uniref:hypothetical protein n=1 Tax=Nitrospirillum amazonense TaxID=28077 RepID=UPI002DD42443|nr:hypothetical protein [Nitrospirillum amazonense]MEC4591628.1 hypothetical protein [Nitrospirillum amazonense]
MSDLPEPLVPADVDLRDFEFMPLDVARLRDSDISALEDAEAFRAAVMSWCASWHQVPAASLPDDDVTLCKLLGYGRDIKTWRRLRAAGALRGWTLHSDGRLYHRVVGEKALEAWLEKLKQRLKSGAGNASRWGVEFDPTDTNRAIAVAVGMLAKLNPKSKALSKLKPLKASNGHGQGVPQDIPQGSHRECDSDPKGQGQRQGSITAADAREPDAPDGLSDDTGADAAHPPNRALSEVGDRVMAAMGLEPDDPKWLGDYGPIQGWLNAGANPELDILPTIRRRMANRTGPPPRTLAYFTPAVMEAVAARNSTPETPNVRQQRDHRRPSPHDSLLAGFGQALARRSGTQNDLG